MSEFLRDLQAAGRPATTQRSYSLALLRWFRFTWAVGRPVGPGDQGRGPRLLPASPARRQARAAAGRPGPVPGKRPASAKYAPSTVAHCETVCRGFYAYHLEAGTGPIVNPFPLARPGRANAHHNPLDPFPQQKAGLFRPRVPAAVPQADPRQRVQRAVRPAAVEPGPGPGRVLGLDRRPRVGAPQRHRARAPIPGQQLITVIRKGSRAIQPLPASPDAFVWLRLYQQEMHGLVPAGPDDPLWWTLRRPFRPLAYNAARMMFDRANAADRHRVDAPLPAAYCGLPARP